ncbi:MULTISPECIES: YheE family protein [Bacillaceae]|uniref:YheE family protein n=1 Tax=Bacillaceae TaxID=186817 RepID=UPI00047A5BED|nr:MULTISPECIES: YheE family protein [Bacillaceae]UOE95467.1 YheE family protein [Alkalihalobacillus sp. LMS39]
MLSHFQWKELRNNLVRQEWEISFFFEGTYYRGTYFKDGSIEWHTLPKTDDDRRKLELQVHDLMLYHVYEDH